MKKQLILLFCISITIFPQYYSKIPLKFSHPKNSIARLLVSSNHYHFKSKSQNIAKVKRINSNEIEFKLLYDLNDYKVEKYKSRLLSTYSYLLSIDFIEENTVVRVQSKNSWTNDQINEFVSHFSFVGYEFV